MQCPGQDSRFWKADAIYEARCPQCGRDVEFFKDDTARKCPACGHRFVNPELDFGCAAYCQFAEQCLGSLPEEIKARQQDLQQNLVKDKVRLEVRRVLKDDALGLRLAASAAAYAERIGKDEGGDLGVILMGASLASLVRREAERRCGGLDRAFLQGQGTALAREILVKLGAGPETIDEVCDIVARQDQAPEQTEDQTPKQTAEQESLNFRVVADALVLAELEARQIEAQDSPERIDHLLLTARGRDLAGEHLPV